MDSARDSVASGAAVEEVPLLPTGMHTEAFVEVEPPAPRNRDVARAYIIRSFRVRREDCALLGWLPSYNWATFRADAVAAVTVGTMLVPQAMAYALLAGLPPQYGLYASIFPSFLYGALTTCAVIAPGPVAPGSILLEGQLRLLTNAPPQSDAWVAAALQLSALVGLVQLCLGLMRFGAVASLLSWPVMSGFTSAAALLIIASQASPLLGISSPPADGSFFVRMYYILGHLGEVHGPTAALSLACLLVLLLGRHPLLRWRSGAPLIPPFVPLPLALVLISILASWGLDLEGAGFRVVGAIPGGLPTPTAPTLPRDPAAWLPMLPSALLLALVSYVQTVSLALTFGRRSGDIVNPNTELLALGVTSLLGTSFSSYAVSGSITRTALQAASGARSPASIIFCGIFMLAATLALGRFFYFLPLCVLAAIIIVSARSMIDTREAITLWRWRFADFAQFLITAVLILAVDIQTGILAGVGSSLLLLMLSSFQPRVTELGQLPGTDVFVALSRYPAARRLPGIRVLRLDGELHFGNAGVVTKRLNQLLEEHRGAKRAREGAIAASAAEGATAGLIKGGALVGLEGLGDSGVRGAGGHVPELRGRPSRAGSGGIEMTAVVPRGGSSGALSASPCGGHTLGGQVPADAAAPPPGAASDGGAGGGGGAHPGMRDYIAGAGGGAATARKQHTLGASPSRVKLESLTVTRASLVEESSCGGSGNTPLMDPSSVSVVGDAASAAGGTPPGLVGNGFGPPALSSSLSSSALLHRRPGAQAPEGKLVGGDRHHAAAAGVGTSLAAAAAADHTAPGSPRASVITISLPGPSSSGGGSGPPHGPETPSPSPTARPWAAWLQQLVYGSGAVSHTHHGRKTSTPAPSPAATASDTYPPHRHRRRSTTSPVRGSAGTGSRGQGHARMVFAAVIDGEEEWGWESSGSGSGVGTGAKGLAGGAAVKRRGGDPTPSTSASNGGLGTGGGAWTLESHQGQPQAGGSGAPARPTSPGGPAESRGRAASSSSSAPPAEPHPELLLHAVVLDCCRVVGIDATAWRELAGVIEAFGRERVHLLLSGLPGPVRDAVERYISSGLAGGWYAPAAPIGGDTPTADSGGGGGGGGMGGGEDGAAAGGGGGGDLDAEVASPASPAGGACDGVTGAPPTASGPMGGPTHPARPPLSFEVCVAADRFLSVAAAVMAVQGDMQRSAARRARAQHVRDLQRRENDARDLQRRENDALRRGEEEERGRGRGAPGLAPRDAPPPPASIRGGGGREEGFLSRAASSLGLSGVPALLLRGGATTDGPFGSGSARPGAPFPGSSSGASPGGAGSGGLRGSAGSATSSAAALLPRRRLPWGTNEAAWAQGGGAGDGRAPAQQPPRSGAPPGYSPGAPSPDPDSPTRDGHTGTAGRVAGGGWVAAGDASVPPLPVASLAGKDAPRQTSFGGAFV